MQDKEKIEKIKANIVNCKLCKLCKDRRNPVPGSGNINAKVLFVGEAPGRNEDEKGLPFIGMAGKILDEAFENAGIQRKEVYITNVVKCRPPNNRIPEQEEIDNCKGYLDEEIKIVSPNVICILGATAMQSILNLKGIHTHRGKTIVRGNNTYFITYHPAATIYNNKLKEIFFKDIEKLFKSRAKDIDEYFATSNSMQN
jgi:uracil-DNA glycosylase family 4